MMLAGLPVPDPAIDALAELVRAAGADDLADRLDRALTDGVKLIALTLGERAVMLAAFEDPPPELTELRARVAQRSRVEAPRRDRLGAVHGHPFAAALAPFDPADQQEPAVAANLVSDDPAHRPREKTGLRHQARRIPPR